MIFDSLQNDSLIFGVKHLVGILFAFLVVCGCAGCNGEDSKASNADNAAGKFVFATYFDSDRGIEGVFSLIESLREFGGKFADSPLWIYIPEGITVSDSALLKRMRGMGIEIRHNPMPVIAKSYFYGGKPFAAAAAESAAADQGAVLVWLDNDAVILSEPTAFDLDSGISLAYCPVMHNRSGTLFGQPPDAFWSRIYELQGLTDDMLFPMTTPADNQTIRAYFHCGILAVRPEKQILKRWAEAFELLCGDSTLASMCKEEVTKNIFLHQTALTGAVLHTLDRGEMVEFPHSYHFPVFFDRAYGADQPYNDLTGVVVLRVVFDLTKMGPNWPEELTGPPEKIAWLKEHLQR